MFYIYAHKPFSESIVNSINIYSEFILSLIFILLPLQQGNTSSTTKDSLDDTMIYLIYSIMCVQVIAPFVILFNKLKIKFIEHRNKNKVFPINTQGIVTTIFSQEIAWKDLK